MLIKIGFEKDASLLFILIMASNAINYIFQIVMGRFLNVELYGTLNALLSIFMIATLPIPVLIVVVTKHIAENMASTIESANDIFMFLLKYSIYFTGIICFVLLVCGVPISTYFNIQNHYYIVIIVISAGLNYMLPVFYGSIQGVNDFKRLGILYICASSTKFLVGVLLVIVGLNLYAPLLGIFVSTALTIYLGMHFVRKYFAIRWTKNIDFDRQSLIKYSLSSLVISVFMGLLMHTDVLWIKRYFSSYDAGMYSAIAILGKIIIYMPTAIIAVMLPTVVLANKLGKNTFWLLSKSFLYSVLLMFISIVILNIFPDLLINLLFGKKYLGSIQYLFPVSIMAFAIGSLSVIVNFLLALNRVKILISSLAIGGFLYIMLVLAFHRSIFQIIFILTAVTACVVMVNVALLVKIHMVHRHH